MGNELVPYADNCLNFDTEPNPKAEVTRSPFTESRCGRTRKQRRARPNVWKILISEDFIFSGFKITPHLHESNEDEKALMWPLVELEQAFSQTSQKGAHLKKMEHFP